MKRLAIVTAAILLSGCAGKKIEYLRVPCLTKEQVEQRRAAEPERVADQLTGYADEDIRVVAGSAVLLRSWGQGNLDILATCTG